MMLSASFLLCARDQILCGQDWVNIVGDRDRRRKCSQGKNPQPDIGRFSSLLRHEMTSR